MSLPIRRVGLRDNLLMIGNHHMPAGKRHWRCDAPAFAITDYHGTPLVWIEGREVVGEMSATVAKPTHAGKGGEAVSPLANERLLYFEVGKKGGFPIVRTWWARGKNLERTMKVCREEIIDPKTCQRRFAELLKLMDWAG